MRIHFTAPSWHGGFHIFMNKAFRSLGHDVCYFDDSGSPWQKNFRRFFVRLPRMEYAADDQFREFVSSDWITSVKKYKPNLVVIEHAPNVLPSAIKRIRKEGYTVFSWTDSPPAGAQAKDLLASLKASDKIFTDDREKEWMTTLFQPDEFEFLPLAGDPDVYHPIANVKKEYDVVFVGSMSPQTGDGVIRAEILSSIPDKYTVGIFGNDIDYWFKYYPRLKKRTLSVSALDAKSVNEIYNKAKIVLSIYTTFHIETVSARTHEAALAGAFQIVDYRKGLDELYPKGLFPRFNYANEVNGLIDYWIVRDGEREKIAAELRQHALAHHTWRHRAEELLKFFKK